MFAALIDLRMHKSGKTLVDFYDKWRNYWREKDRDLNDYFFCFILTLLNKAGDTRSKQDWKVLWRLTSIEINSSIFNEASALELLNIQTSGKYL